MMNTSSTESFWSRIPMDILVLDGFGWALWSNQLTMKLLTWQVTIAFCASITTARGWEIVQLSGMVHQIQLQQVEQREVDWIHFMLGNQKGNQKKTVESSITYIIFSFGVRHVLRNSSFSRDLKKEMATKTLPVRLFCVFLNGIPKNGSGPRRWDCTTTAILWFWSTPPRFFSCSACMWPCATSDRRPGPHD